MSYHGLQLLHMAGLTNLQRIPNEQKTTPIGREYVCLRTVCAVVHYWH